MPHLSPALLPQYRRVAQTSATYLARRPTEATSVSLLTSCGAAQDGESVNSWLDAVAQRSLNSLQQVPDILRPSRYDPELEVVQCHALAGPVVGLSEDGGRALVRADRLL